jgi:ribose transport system substrate-binding protein
MLQRSIRLGWLAGLSFMILLGCLESSNSTGAGNTATGDTKTGAGAGTEPTAAASGTKRIILLNNTDSPFWDAARAGIDKAAEDLKLKDKGFTAGMDTNNGTDEGQIEKLRQYFSNVRDQSSGCR